VVLRVIAKMRRMWLVVVGGVLLATTVALLLLRPDPGARITRENFQHLHRGMTRPEVEAILGLAGDYRTGPLVDDTVSQSILSTIARDASLPPDGRLGEWVGDSGVVIVLFEDEERASHLEFLPLRRLDQGWVENLLWRINRQWHHWFPN
jgi:hypothetical protein